MTEPEQMRFELTDPLPRVAGDQIRIERVLVNIPATAPRFSSVNQCITKAS